MKLNKNHRQPIVPGTCLLVLGRFGRCALALAGGLAVCLIGAAPTQAQEISADPVRVTVHAYSGGVATNIIINLDDIDTNATLTLTVDISGAAGVTDATLDAYSFTETTGTNVLETNAVLTVYYNSSVPQTGVNEIAITASGDYSYRLPIPVKSAVMWAGDTNNTAYETGSNWEQSAVPTTGDVAMFAGLPGNSTNATTNVVISSDTAALAGLRFGQLSNTYNVEIKPSATVLVTGVEGFQTLADGYADDTPVTFFGGGGLVVSNSAANFGLYSDFSTLNLAGLGNLVVDVDRISLNNFSLYPNRYTNGLYSPSGSHGFSNAGQDVYLAQSNHLKTAWIGGDAVITNTGEAYFPRPYAFSFSMAARTMTGTPQLFLGVTNAIFAESILFGGGGNNNPTLARVLFNTDTNVIPTNVVPALYIRGELETNRCAVLTVGDNSGPYLEDQNSKSDVDLTAGRVDALIDKLYVGRDRWQCGDNDGMDAELQIGGSNAAGTILDVNTAYVSMQEQGNNHISDEILNGNDPPADPQGSVRSILRVGSNAVFKVSDALHLGYTTADADDIRKAYQGYGAVFIEGGTVMVNNVLVGGVTKLSGNDQRFNHLPFDQQNGFTLTGGGELIVTNEVAQQDRWLNGLVMSDSTITFHLDGNRSTPYVYATNIVTSGAGNTIRIASLDNVVTFPTQVPLIAYNSASPNFGVEFVVPNRYGYVVNNTVNKTIDVVILDTPPSALVWNGSPGTDWNTTSPNWQGAAVFANGDFALFDDTALSASVSVPGTVYAGGAGVLVSNNTKAYTLGGAGAIAGTAPMNKWGTNSLAVNTTSELPLTIHEGSVTGTGALGATIVGSNASLSFSGAINGLVTSGTTVLASGANVARGAVVEGGTLTNSGRITGSFDVEGSQATVLPGGFVITPSPSTCRIATTNSTLTLSGVWSNGIVSSPLQNGTYRIDVFGTLNGTGRIGTGLANTTHGTGTAPAYWSRLVIGSDGVFSPGAAPGNLTVFTNQSQLDFSSGSTIVIDVDMDSAPGSNPKGNAGTGSTSAKNSDVIFSSRWSTRTGTIRLNKVGSTPWTNGTVLKIFGKPSEQVGGAFRNRVFDGTEAQKPIIDPPSPGLGLLWNLEAGPDGGGIATNGIIAIVGTATNPPTLGVTHFQGTNITFSWPTNHVGWELLRQARALTNGISTARSNWTVVAGSTTTNSITITNWIDDDAGAVFYRLAHPEFD